MTTIPATQPGQPAQKGQGVEREGKKDCKSNILSQGVSTIEISSEETLSFTEFTFSFLYDGQTISNVGEKKPSMGTNAAESPTSFIQILETRNVSQVGFLFFRFKDICIYIIIYLR